MNKLMVLIMTMIFMFTNIGCWDVRDVSNRVFVTSMGLDATPNGYKVTVVMPRPANIRNRSAQDYTITKTEEAETVSKAIGILQSKMSRDISFGHLRILVIGEKLARKVNFNDLMSFLTKNPEVAMRFMLMFVDGGEAQDVFKTIPFLDRSMSTELVGLAQAGDNLGSVRSKRFYTLLSDLRQTNGNALATRLIIKKTDGQPEIYRIGSAIFTNWRLVGWLNADEMQAANWILRQNTDGMVVGKIGSRKYSCLIDLKKVQITPKINKGRLKFEVNIHAIGNIAEQQGTSLDLTEPRNLQKLDQVLTKTILEQAIRGVYKSQKEMGIDYLGFDRALIRNEPELYKKLDWAKVYPDVPVEIKVGLRIPRVGVERR